ncbi:MAG: C4-type zinc ribbon domain-containing protein [Candidatus Omnitrophota bacterium]|nr:C4-type zinc ribbon domain-containing protein [Candidatus Omnitrophota bacterium]
MTTVAIADQLKALIELQKLDGEIYRLRRDLATQPVQAAQLKDEQAKRTLGLQTAEARTKSLELKRNQLEAELGSKEQQIKKLQTQTYQVKTNREYSALQLEVEGLKADKSVFEEEILKLMEEVEQAKAQTVSEKEQLKVQEGELKSRLDQIDQESRKIKNAIEQLQAARAALVPKVDPKVLKQYERILERKEGSALVPVRGNSCSGCNMLLPPQAINEVMMNTRLIPCESCARILYIEPEAGS